MKSERKDDKSRKSMWFNNCNNFFLEINFNDSKVALISLG